MLTKLKDRFTLSVLNSLLAGYETEGLDAGKRIISAIAGVYILQKGIKDIRKHPVHAIEKVALGGVLLYSAASGLNKKITKKPTEISEMRKNQIQGNDPRSDVPAFV